ncbi:ribonuclease Z [Patescibacteria group bacterium]|nr:ribonuclease Z [Patescibacteria group bacterium]
MTDKIIITFLGTGDSVPSRSRNHPAFLMTYKGENILVDCGEGTQRQFRKAGLNPCKITRILITHWHADHILGIPGMLKTLGLSGYNQILHIYCPKGTKILIEQLLNLFKIKTEYPLEIKEVKGKFFDTGDFYLEAESMTHGIPCNAYSFIKKERIRIDKKILEKLGIPEGPHLKELKERKNLTYNGKSYSFKKLTYQEKPLKVSFILDTSLNDRIIPFVMNSDILISESTFTSDLEKKAEEYKHLTVSQVAGIAKKAKVKRLFLVHISQRFSKDLKRVLEDSKRIFNSSYLPKDLEKIEL